ncbi:MAG TPA: YigZ family protein [Arachidicoccus sp.]|nr:YigZ family protein [Arachidicoccus sp.]
MASQDTFFYTIEQEAVAEFKDKGSKFLAYAFQIKGVSDCKVKIEQLKKQHPKAVHFCYAYRLGVDGLIFRSSDDGEPAGSAGKPILGQITSKQLTDVAVIVVRYFGGTLLGVPGLINAYKTTTALALQMVPITKKQVTIDCQLDFDYTQMNEVMRWVKNFNASVSAQELQLFCKMVIQVPKVAIEEAKTVFSALQGIHFQILKK